MRVIGVLLGVTGSLLVGIGACADKTAVASSSTSDVSTGGGSLMSVGSTGLSPTTGTDTGTTGAPATTSGPAPTSGTSETSAAFTQLPDVPAPVDCNPWIDDCPVGQKCVPYAGEGDGGLPKSLRCVPIVPDPDGLGEPCNAGPIESGDDSCDKRLICHVTDWDSQTYNCLPMCTGSPDMPDCADPAMTCLLPVDFILNVCFPQCDPLAPDCPRGDLCVPRPQNSDDWYCVFPDPAPPGQLFDACIKFNACAPGLVCSDSTLAVECDPMATSCCLPVCDADEPNTCPGQGQECAAWYDDPADAAPFNTDVGLCRLP